MGVFYFIMLRSHSITEESSHRNLRNELKLKPRRNAFYFLLIVARQSCFLTQDHLLRGDTAHGRMGPPALMINLKNAPKALPRGQSSGSIFSLKGLSSYIYIYLGLCQVDKNQEEQIYTGILFHMSTMSSCFNVSWCFCI